MYLPLAFYKENYTKESALERFKHHLEANNNLLKHFGLQFVPAEVVVEEFEDGYVAQFDNSEGTLSGEMMDLYYQFMQLAQEIYEAQ